MRVWEFERYDWDGLDAVGSARGVPNALDELSSASTIDEATAAYWKIDNCVVVQGTVYEAAVATAACAVVLLPIASASARPMLIELLEQFTLEEHSTAPLLRDALLREIVRGFGFYVALLQYGADLERSMCIDLLLYCAGGDPSLRPRVEFYLERAASDSTNTLERRKEAATRLRFEKDAW